MSTPNVVEPHLETYVGTMRFVINVEDELEAHLTMDRLQVACSDLLDEDDGDVVAVTQIIPFTTAVSPEETLTILKRARNALIRTRVKACWDVARELDMQIYNLHLQVDQTLSPQYDYSRMLDFAERIFNKKEEPNE